MNHDEFAFLNQQLAAMLREGIPLEGAIRRLCQETKRGRHRTVFLKIEGQLKEGIPLDQAVAQVNVPILYREMIRLGVVTNDLPAVLTLTADYYRKAGAISARLRALLTYPLIVLLVSLLLSLWIAFLYRTLNADLDRVALSPVTGLFFRRSHDTVPPVTHWWLNLWIPPALITLAVTALLVGLSSPATRAKLRWRIGPFKDASLAQLASALHLLLRRGLSLRESLAFAAQMESSNGAGRDLRLWSERHAEGRSRFGDMTEGSATIPSRFIWIVSSAGDDLAGGFAQAAELYGERARRRAELLLNLVLPCALLALGLMIMGQIEPFLTSVFDVFTPIFKAGQVVGGIR